MLLLIFLEWGLGGHATMCYFVNWGQIGCGLRIWAGVSQEILIHIEVWEALLYFSCWEFRNEIKNKQQFKNETVPDFHEFCSLVEVMYIDINTLIDMYITTNCDRENNKVKWKIVIGRQHRENRLDSLFLSTMLNQKTRPDESQKSGMRVRTFQAEGSHANIPRLVDSTLINWKTASMPRTWVRNRVETSNNHRNALLLRFQCVQIFKQF